MSEWVWVLDDAVCQSRGVGVKGDDLRSVSFVIMIRPRMTVTRSHARCDNPFHQRWLTQVYL